MPMPRDTQEKGSPELPPDRPDFRVFLRGLQAKNPKKYYFSPYFFIDSCREIPRMGGDV